MTSVKDKGGFVFLNYLDLGLLFTFIFSESRRATALRCPTFDAGG